MRERKLLFAKFLCWRSSCNLVRHFGTAIFWRIGVSCHLRNQISALYWNDVFPKNIFSKFYSGNNCVFKEAKILKIDDIYKFRVALYMYKVLKFNQYPSLQNNLNLFYPGHDHATRSADQLVLPFPRVAAIRIGYKFQFVNIWNEIPRRLRNLENVKNFKKELHAYFLSKY